MTASKQRYLICFLHIHYKRDEKKIPLNLLGDMANKRVIPNQISNYY